MVSFSVQGNFNRVWVVLELKCFGYGSNNATTASPSINITNYSESNKTISKLQEKILNSLNYNGI